MKLDNPWCYSLTIVTLISGYIKKNESTVWIILHFNANIS